MDTAQLRAAVEQARRFTHEAAGGRFVLVLPTQFAIDCIAAELKAFPRMQRKLVTAALRGWDGISTALLGTLEGVQPEPLAYTEANVELLFDERPDIEAALMDAIGARVSARREALEAAQGN